MKTTSYSSASPTSARISMILFVVMILMGFGSTSCEYYGRDGRPGKSYLAIDYRQSEPYYIEAGTKYIPEVFYWGEFYRVPAGFYLLYYEGEYYNGRSWVDYAWEVEYEIWENPGEYGSPYGVDGFDGADAYFTIECAPNGPYVYVDEYYKAAKEDGSEGFELVSNTGEEIKIRKTSNEFTLEVTYRSKQPQYTPAR